MLLGEFQLQLELILSLLLVQGVAIHLPEIHIDDRVRVPVRKSASFTLEGNVTDDSGHSLAKAVVSAIRREDKGVVYGLPAVRTETMSDDKGHYVFTALTVGNYDFCARLENYRESCTKRFTANRKLNFKLKRLTH
jgi:hypothetical protein